MSDEPTTCKTCRFFIPVPRQPNQPVSLGEPKQGECRGGPPVMFAAGVLPNGTLNIQVMYPRINEAMPICRCYEDKEAWRE